MASITTQRKLVQFIDGLGNALVLTTSNDKDVGLVWERVSGTSAESMWVVETTPSGKGMRCQNYRYPMVYLEAINDVVRAVSTVNYPVPLPIALKKSKDHTVNPYNFCTPDGTLLKIKNDSSRRSFYLNTIANQYVDNASMAEVKGGMSGWAVFGIVIMTLAVITVIVGIIMFFRNGEVIADVIPSSSSTTNNQDEMFANTVFDVFAS